MQMNKVIILAALICLSVQQSSVISSPQSTRVAQLCANGYFWTTQSCMPCPTVSNGWCSCTSQNACTTTTCNSGYTLTKQGINNKGSNVCVQNTLTNLCSTGCTNCQYGTTNAVMCFNCTQGYTLIGNLCIQNLNCQTFDMKSALCTSCQPGYYMNYVYQYPSNQAAQNTYLVAAYTPSQCSSCMTGCQNCTSSSTCQQCQQGYFWQNPTTTASGSCQTCVSFCTQCTNGTTQGCTQCMTGYTLANQTNVCTPNAVAPVVPCGTGCSTCNNGTCTACQAGFAPVTNKNCYPCPSGCQSCSVMNGTTTTSCDACLDTYTRVVTSGQASTCNSCSQAVTNSLRCRGPFDSDPTLNKTVPTQCNNGYFLINETCVAYSTPQTCLVFANPYYQTVMNSTTTNCLNCLLGYTLNSPTCVANIPMCSTQNNTVCNQCMAGYYLPTTPGPSCMACPTGCTTCTSSNNCTACNAGYFMNNNACSQCSTSMQCATCSNANSCLTCNAGYFANVTNGNVTQCNMCPANCATCQAPGNSCTSCNTGYFLAGSSGCVPVAQMNCQVYDQTKGCTYCQYGYYLKNNACFQCVDPLAQFVCRQNSAPPANGSSPSSQTAYGSIVTILAALLAVLLA